ncbi:high mobility group box domain-containing protein, partial [Cyathus striatus]
PRPLNAFMIYRAEKQKEMQDLKLPRNNLSKIIGARWRALSAEERLVYKGKADDAAIEHKIKYPDYKYSP